MKIAKHLRAMSLLAFGAAILAEPCRLKGRAGSPASAR
jgi:hypothetical protein